MSKERAEALRDAARTAYNLEDGSVIDCYRSEIADWLEELANEEESG